CAADTMRRAYPGRRSAAIAAPLCPGPACRGRDGLAALTKQLPLTPALALEYRGEGVYFVSVARRTPGQVLAGIVFPRFARPIAPGGILAGQAIDAATPRDYKIHSLLDWPFYTDEAPFMHPSW